MLLDGGRTLAKEKGCLFYETSSSWDKKRKDGSQRLGIGVLIEAVCEEVLLKQGLMQDKQVLSLSEDVSCNKELIESCAC